MPAYEWDNFLDDITIIVLMPAGAVGRMRSTVGPGLTIQTIYGKNFDLARFDKPRKCIDHSPIFKIIKATLLRWEYQYRLAIITINFQFQVMSNSWTEPLVIFDLHGPSPIPG